MCRLLGVTSERLAVMIAPHLVDTIRLDTCSSRTSRTMGVELGNAHSYVVATTCSCMQENVKLRALSGFCFASSQADSEVIAMVTGRLASMSTCRFPPW